MSAKHLEAKLDQLGQKLAETKDNLKPLELKHQVAYRDAAMDPDGAEKKISSIREQIQQNKDLSAGILAAMEEIGGQILDHRIKSYEIFKAELEKDIRKYEIEAGRHIAIGMAYLTALGSPPSADFLKILKSGHSKFAKGTSLANNEELVSNPIPSLVPRKQEVQKIKGYNSGISDRRYLIQKIIAPVIRVHVKPMLGRA